MGVGASCGHLPPLLENLIPVDTAGRSPDRPSGTPCNEAHIMCKGGGGVCRAPLEPVAVRRRLGGMQQRTGADPPRSGLRELRVRDPIPLLLNVPPVLSQPPLLLASCHSPACLL